MAHRVGTLIAMTAQVSVTRDIAAPPETVWAMVSDVTRMGEWSPEAESARWLGGATGPTAGARFRGTNRRGKRTWNTVGTVVDAEPGRVFCFHVTAMCFKVAEWRYTFEPTDSGCRVAETWTDHRGRIVGTVGGWKTGVDDRPTHNRVGMERTLDRLKSVAESTASATP